MGEKYRVSLQVARQLKEAGFPQDGCDAYWTEDHHSCQKPSLMIVEAKIFDLHNHYEKLAAAPCVGRLGEELSDLSGYMLPYKQIDGKWNYGKELFVTEADARALMWIELKKRGIIK